MEIKDIGFVKFSLLWKFMQPGFASTWEKSWSFPIVILTCYTVCQLHLFVYSLYTIIYIFLKVCFKKFTWLLINIDIHKSYFLDAIRKREEKNIVRFDFFLSLFTIHCFLLRYNAHCMTVSWFWTHCTVNTGC